MINSLKVLEVHSQELKEHGAKRIGVFGSFARGGAKPTSDVDIYLEFEDGMRTYDNFFAIHELLETAFGRPIDLVTEGSLNEQKSHRILPSVRYAVLDA